MTDKKNTEKAAPRVLTNCTGSPRGFMLSSGRIMLGPREMRSLTDAEYDEITAMFRTETFQRMLDGGIFRLSGLSGDEQIVEVKTPEPPESLKGDIQVDSLAARVGTSTGQKASDLKVSI